MYEIISILSCSHDDNNENDDDSNGDDDGNDDKEYGNTRRSEEDAVEDVQHLPRITKFLGTEADTRKQFSL